VKYVITADQDKAEKPLMTLLGAEEWKELVSGCDYEVADTVHGMNQTKKAFRLVIKREVQRQRKLFERMGEPYFYQCCGDDLVGR